MQQEPLLELIGLQKLIIVLKMLLFLVLKKEEEELAEDQQKMQGQTLPIEDHLQEVRIPLPESRDQEITVQDLMINQTIIIY